MVKFKISVTKFNTKHCTRVLTIKELYKKWTIVDIEPQNNPNAFCILKNIANALSDILYKVSHFPRNFYCPICPKITLINTCKLNYRLLY